MLNNWKSTLFKMATTLDIPWPVKYSIINQEMDSFLDINLRHSYSSLDDLYSRVRTKELPESVARCMNFA